MATTFFTMHADASVLLVSGEFAGMAGVRIHFDLNVADGEWLRLISPPRPTLLITRRITGYIRSDGRMYDTPAVSAVPYDIDDPGNLGVRLPANDPDLNLSNAVTYCVSGGGTIEGRPWSFYPFYTPAVPAIDTTVDLASFAPGPGHTVVGIPELGLIDHLADMGALGKALGRSVTRAQGIAALGGTEVGDAVFTAASAAAGRDALETDSVYKLVEDPPGSGLYKQGS